MDHNLLLKAYKATLKGTSYCFATVVETTLKGTPRKSGAKMIVFPDESLYGTIGGGRNEKAAQKECLKALKTGKSSIVTYDYFGKKGQSVCGGQIKVFIEPFLADDKFIICGAGHIALPLSIQAKMLNFNVRIIDNRKSFANKTRFPHVDTINVSNHAKKLKTLKIDSKTYIMIVTHGNEFDYQCLKTVVKSDAAYIGVISSKAKKIKFMNRLKTHKIENKYLKKIDIPAGLDIGAQTPEEISVSIISKIVEIRNKNRINSAKFRS